MQPIWVQFNTGSGSPPLLWSGAPRKRPARGPNQLHMGPKASQEHFIPGPKMVWKTTQNHIQKYDFGLRFFPVVSTPKAPKRLTEVTKKVHIFNQKVDLGVFHGIQKNVQKNF